MEEQELNESLPDGFYWMRNKLDEGPNRWDVVWLYKKHLYYVNDWHAYRIIHMADRVVIHIPEPK